MDALARRRFRVHLRSKVDDVWLLLSTDDGRERFWAERSVQEGSHVTFEFPNGVRRTSEIVKAQSPSRFVLTYFGYATTFVLDDDGAGGTDLSIWTDDEDVDTAAGWVSVLLALKAAVDHGVDLRNHDPARTWSQDYVDN